MIGQLLLCIFSALSGMGVGSGGLPVLLFVWKFGYSQLTAQGLNLLCFLCSASASILSQLRNRISFLRVYLLLVSGIPGAYLGCFAAIACKPEASRRIFGGFLVASGVLTFVSIHRNKKVGKTP